MTLAQFFRDDFLGVFPGFFLLGFQFLHRVFFAINASFLVLANAGHSLVVAAVQV